ncbi:hypothetical protein IRJ41_012528 [Triplophysa rosa]|uniref:Uncharacterized protein n=1 Tax=Triplophysa rosa TaxID=992332 RepID=A0A9W7WT98_TRIRA|nr:hypothetical protein IRJ41_012528 [Triplophysa rosa]
MWTQAVKTQAGDKSARDGYRSSPNSQHNSLASHGLAPPQVRPCVRGCGTLDVERGDPLRAALSRQWACFLAVSRRASM